jgi:hypothetical protein
MKTTILLIALLFSTLSLALTHVDVQPVAPIGTVTVVDDEVEIEYIPHASVEVVHSEVEINGERS